MAKKMNTSTKIIIAAAIVLAIYFLFFNKKDDNTETNEEASDFLTFSRRKIARPQPKMSISDCEKLGGTAVGSDCVRYHGVSGSQSYDICVDCVS